MKDLNPHFFKKLNKKCSKWNVFKFETINLFVHNSYLNLKFIQNYAINNRYF